MCRVSCLDTLWAKNFAEIIICDEHYMSALCSHKSECRPLNFCHFYQKLQTSKWPPFLERGNFFGIEQSILHIYPVDQKFRRNCSISHGLGDTRNFKFHHFCQNSKIQNGRHFWKAETFVRIEQRILHTYPVGQKFRRNCSISHGLGDTSNFKFYHFCQKF